MLTIQKQLHPASPAALMATGIFLIGTFAQFPTIDNTVGTVFAILLSLTGIAVYGQLLRQLAQPAFRKQLLGNPMNPFLFGTWIAGASMLCLVMLKYFPGFLVFARCFTVLLLCCWGAYLLLVLSCFKKLLMRPKNLLIHGVVLLAAVATQSMVILVSHTFSPLPSWFLQIWIGCGMLLYAIGLLLIICAFHLHKTWNLVHDWKNTNCIIHGGLSITGLAMLTTNAFSSQFILCCWCLATLLLILIEMVEVWRGLLRFIKFGLQRGLLTYDTTQWSRNFTFGMFFAFSHAMLLQIDDSVSVYVTIIIEQFLSVWTYVVLFLLILELYLAFRSHFQSKNTSSQKSRA